MVNILHLIVNLILLLYAGFPQNGRPPPIITTLSRRRERPYQTIAADQIGSISEIEPI